jgi:hypothetical protein
MYQLTFSDNTTFKGQSFNGDWNKMPILPIKRFEYFFATNKISFEGFGAYNHSYTSYQFLKGNKKITCLYLMCKDDNKVQVFIYDFITKKMYKYVSVFGKELMSPKRNKLGDIIGWEQAQPITGWREGEVSIPHVEVHKNDLILP